MRASPLGKHVHQLGGKVRVGCRGCGVELYANRSSHFEILGEGRRSEYQNIRTQFDSPLVHRSPGEDFWITAHCSARGRHWISRIELKSIDRCLSRWTGVQHAIPIERVGPALFPLDKASVNLARASGHVVLRRASGWRP